MDKIFDFWDEHPIAFYSTVLVVDLAVLFAAVAGVALIVKAVFF
jgi:hypothetical protein